MRKKDGIVPWSKENKAKKFLRRIVIILVIVAIIFLVKIMLGFLFSTFDVHNPLVNFTSRDYIFWGVIIIGSMFLLLLLSIVLCIWFFVPKDMGPFFK